MTPPWFRLLQDLRNEPRIAREAPTLAFLLGATQFPLEAKEIAENEARGALAGLLASFVDETPVDRVVHITRCSLIHEPVVRLLPADYAAYAKHGLESTTQKRRTVMLDEEFADASRASIDHVGARLFQAVGKPVCSGCFSFSKGAYYPFDDYERRVIRESIG